MAESDTKKEGTNFISEMRRRGYVVERAEGINFGLTHLTEADGATVADEVEKQKPDILVLECGGHSRRLARRIENFMHNRIPPDDKRYQDVFKNPFIMGAVKGLQKLVSEGKKAPVVVFSDISVSREINTFVPRFNAYIHTALEAVSKKLSFDDAKKLLQERTIAYVAADQERERSIVAKLPDAITFGRRGQHLATQKNLKVMFAYGADHTALAQLASDFGIPTRQSWQHPEMPRDSLSQYSVNFRRGGQGSEEQAEKALLWSIIERTLPKIPGIQQIQFASVDHLKRFFLVIVDGLSPQQRKEIYDSAVAGTEVEALQKAMAGKSYTFRPPLRRGQKPPFQIVVNIPPAGTIVDLTPKKPDGSQK
jgi:hypothetical protein